MTGYQNLDAALRDYPGPMLVRIAPRDHGAHMNLMALVPRQGAGRYAGHEWPPTSVIPDVIGDSRASLLRALADAYDQLDSKGGASV